MKMRWQTFIYNYRWSDYVNYIDGWIPKLALAVPVLGYLILFNDQITQSIVFKKIANEGSLEFGLESVERLRLIYFGLIFLGVSNFLYRIKKPHQFKFGDNFVDYCRTGLEIFTLGDWIDMHGSIRHQGHLSTKGKYYDSQWDGFLEAAENTGEGSHKVERDGDWEIAKRKYGGLLRDILYENFFRSDISRRGWLTFCLSLSTLGYLFLLLPSLDLFIKVVISSLGLGATIA